MIEHFQLDDKDKFTSDEKKELRIAALLHDIGHLPFSHDGEEVLKKTCMVDIDHKSIDKQEQLDWKAFFEEDKDKGKTDKFQSSTSKKLHECLSAEIVLNDTSIDGILKTHWPSNPAREKSKNNIAKIIVGVETKKKLQTLLLHSELDADRLDYLLRDSAFTGVGYGHIELDYIISRLSYETDTDEEEQFCIENKGLHGIEHYILARFFLQTQVIRNRKVILTDLLYKKVMEHMVRTTDEKICMADLSTILTWIRGNNGESKQDITDRLHQFYKFTDAFIYTKMRDIHEIYDKEIKEEKNKCHTEIEKQKEYINDCIKVIMDGKIPEPLYSLQKMICIDQKDEDYVSRITQEAQKISEHIAQDLGLCKERVIADIQTERIMKYTELLHPVDENPNREAVRISYKNPDSIKFAAESDASILKGLIDKHLLMFNLYYIGSRGEPETKKEEKKKKITEKFKDFVSQHFYHQGPEQSLCKVLKEQGISAARKLAKKPMFICEKCLRVADKKEHLCEPKPISYRQKRKKR